MASSDNRYIYEKYEKNSIDREVLEKIRNEILNTQGKIGAIITLVKVTIIFIIEIILWKKRKNELDMAKNSYELRENNRSKDQVKNDDLF